MTKRRIKFACKAAVSVIFNMLCDQMQWQVKQEMYEGSGLRQMQR